VETPFTIAWNTQLAASRSFVICITQENNVPITTFSNVEDGLDPNQRHRGHFITDIDIDDERKWVPYADGVWFQPCHFNLTSGDSPYF
jgi:hypothetical protein